MGKSSKATGSVSGNAGAGGRGPLGDGAGRTDAGITRGTDFSADPIGQTSQTGGHDFIADPKSRALATGGRDFSAEHPAPIEHGEDTVCGQSVPLGGKHIVDSFARDGDGGRGTGSIGDGHKPFKLR